MQSAHRVGTSRPARQKPEFKKQSRQLPRAKPPRVRHPPLFTRGPRPFIKGFTQLDGPGDHTPSGLVATLPEWYVYWYLTDRKDMIPGVDFEFQSSVFGGRMDKGGLVFDFFLPGRIGTQGLVINVDGYVWHRYTLDDRAITIMNDERADNQGYFVVHVAEEDVLKRVEYTVENALRGIQLYPRQD